MIKEIIKINIFIAKLIIPFYILADILIYFDFFNKVSFLFIPFTELLDLNNRASVAIAAGIIFELYPAIAFAAPLNLSHYEWTILGIFLGIVHALPIENSIMKKLGFSYIYSTSIRVITAFISVYIYKFFYKNNFIIEKTKVYTTTNYSSFLNMIFDSFYNSVLLTIKIVLIITLLIVILETVKKYLNIYKSLNNIFYLTSGVLLGITYGAGILLKDRDNIKKKHLIFIGTFLLIAHSLIEDPLLFAILGADIYPLIIIRTILAFFIAIAMTFFYSVVSPP